MEYTIYLFKIWSKVPHSTVQVKEKRLKVEVVWPSVLSPLIIPRQMKQIKSLAFIWNIELAFGHCLIGATDITKEVSVQPKEAINRLKQQQHKSIRELGAKSTIWCIFKEEENTGQLDDIKINK